MTDKDSLTLLVAHLHFCQHTNPNRKMQKSYQATAPTTRQTKQRLKEGQLITAVAVAQPQ